MPITWTPVADRVWVRTLPPFDAVSVAVAGRDAVLLVDPGCDAAQARESVESLGALDGAAGLSVAYAVLTHAHLDHAWGATGLAGAEVVAHETVPASWATEWARAGADGDLDRLDDAWRTRLEAASRAPVASMTTFASAWAVDLGDRYVEVAHLGAGHSPGDAVVVVPDARVVVAGDLVDGAGDPERGSDADLTSWTHVLELLMALVTTGTVVVPGHGPTIGQDDVITQHRTLVESA